MIVVVGFTTFWFNSCCHQWVTSRDCLHMNYLFKSLSESPKLMSSLFVCLFVWSSLNKSQSLISKGIFPGMQAHSSWKEMEEGESSLYIARKISRCYFPRCYWKDSFFFVFPGSLFHLQGSPICSELFSHLRLGQPSHKLYLGNH